MYHMGRVVGSLSILICLCIVWTLCKTLATPTWLPFETYTTPRCPPAFWPSHRTWWPVRVQLPSMFCSGDLSSDHLPGLILGHISPCVCTLTLAHYHFLSLPRLDLSTVGTGNHMPPSGYDAHHRPRCVSKKVVTSLRPQVQCRCSHAIDLVRPSGQRGFP